MNGRVYDPVLARFLSRDPFIDGVDSSQGTNGYAYVHNNPLNRIDPSGFVGGGTAENPLQFRAEPWFNDGAEDFLQREQNERFVNQMEREYVGERSAQNRPRDDSISLENLPPPSFVSFANYVQRPLAVFTGSLMDRAAGSTAGGWSAWSLFGVSSASAAAAASRQPSISYIGRVRQNFIDTNAAVPGLLGPPAAGAVVGWSIKKFVADARAGLTVGEYVLSIARGQRFWATTVTVGDSVTVRALSRREALRILANTTGRNAVFAAFSWEAGVLAGSAVSALPVIGSEGSIREWWADWLYEEFGPEENW